MSYGAPYGYGSGYGYGVTGFVGILDRLSVQPYSFWSTVRRATSRWGGPVGRLYRTIDGVEIDIYGRGSLGLVDPNEIAAFAPTGNVLWTKLYDQTGAGRHFEQASNLIMPYACKSGVPVMENGLQSAEFVAAESRRMVVPGSTGAYSFLHTTGGSVVCVARPGDTATTKRVLSTRNSTGAGGFTFGTSASEVFGASSSRKDIAGVATTGLTCQASTASQILVNSHIAAVIDPDNATIASRLSVYVDNVDASVVNAETDSPFVENSQGNLTLGADPSGTNPWEGTATDFGIWNSLIGSGDRGLLWSNASSLWGL